ncbi:MAG: YlxR family protein [Ardenticatenaceae bacterium]|nr:YlxR family protein [Ardenticatenaceae bacterium]
MAHKKQRHTKHIPLRSCFVCRQKTDKRHLTRIVRTPDAGVVVDATGKKNGRGAYLCDQPLCWDKVVKNRGLLNRALLAEVNDDELAAIAAHRPHTSDVVNAHEQVTND